VSGFQIRQFNGSNERSKLNLGHKFITLVPPQSNWSSGLGRFAAFSNLVSFFILK